MVGGEEPVDVGSDVTFIVRRAGKIIDERRVIDDTEVDPVLAKFIEDIFEGKEDDPVLAGFVDTLIELLEKEEEENAKDIED